MHSYGHAQNSRKSQKSPKIVFFAILTNFGVLLRLLLYSVGLETWHGCYLALGLYAYLTSGRSELRDARCTRMKFARAKREISCFRVATVELYY